MIEYLSTSDIAEWFGVKAATVTQWRGRYTDFPEPDAMTGSVAGWLPERRAEIEAWEASRAGQGVGGGRPPKS
ncbi:helix-turn-helix transcriptional regulator [Amycolatopsis halotolerans]|uniref:Helix-turn-helix transcriptional regulator n=1 Tax=Amycolatopsis halotolerans TaxID=330083 RepID=A0ABV7QC96_9PSEU